MSIRRNQVQLIGLVACACATHPTILTAQPNTGSPIRKIVLRVSIPSLTNGIAQLAADPKLNAIRHCDQGKVFDATTVRTKLTATRDSLAQQLFAVKGGHALASFVEDSFPVAIPTSTNPCYHQRGTELIAFVTQDAADQAQRDAERFLSQLEKESDAIRSVTVESSPVDGATFSYAPKKRTADEKPDNTITTGSIVDLWRGNYEYWVKRDGYIDIHGYMTLVDGDAVAINCQLVATPVDGGTADSKPCTHTVVK